MKWSEETRVRTVSMLKATNADALDGPECWQGSSFLQGQLYATSSMVAIRDALTWTIQGRPVVYPWNTYSSSCLLHKVAREQPEKTLSDTYKCKVIIYAHLSRDFDHLPYSSFHQTNTPWLQDENKDATVMFLPENHAYSIPDTGSPVVSNYW